MTRQGATPGPPAVCTGTVVHARSAPTGHRFTYPITYVWLDPDRPDDLMTNHPLWSARRPAPVRFRPDDYLDGTGRPFGPQLRELAEDVVGHRPTGPIRMLTQPRAWGWLFNPITIYLLWDGLRDGPSNGGGPAPDTGRSRGPVAAVLEVTNTPWKERHRYPLALDTAAAQGATFDKSLHVSPFLGEDHRYRLTVSEVAGPQPDSHRPAARRLTMSIDVYVGRIHQPPGDEEPMKDRLTTDQSTTDQSTTGPSPILTTRLVVDRLPATRTTMTKALLTNPLSTHRVSLGIHRQALALWRKRVPFVTHPDRATATPDAKAR